MEELTGKTYDWLAINAKRQVELEADLEGVQPLPGVEELLRKLNDNGFKVAIVSSSSHRWVDAWVEKLDLMKYLEHVVCKGDAPRIKPAPDLYEEGARRFSLQPVQCLVIEDSLNGVKAGNEAGCLTVAVPSRLTSCLDFSRADLVIESLMDLI